MKAVPRPPSRRRRRLSRPSVLAAIAAVLVIAAGAIVLATRDGEKANAPLTTGQRAEPVKANADSLRQVAAAVGHPVYWAPGEKASTYALTRTPDGRLYIRYLPDGVQIGDPRPNFLTIGTYPQDNPLASVQQGAKRQGAVTKDLAGGGVSVTQSDRPTSVFFAYPESKVLIEVYDPTANRAATLVTSGAILPIG